MQVSGLLVGELHLNRAVEPAAAGVGKNPHMLDRVAWRLVRLERPRIAERTAAGIQQLQLVARGGLKIGNVELKAAADDVGSGAGDPSVVDSEPRRVGHGSFQRDLDQKPFVVLRLE